MANFSKYKGHIKDYLYVTLETVPPRILQSALGVTVDGIVGRHTIQALVRTDPKVFYATLAEALNEPTISKEPVTQKDMLMDYLAKAEGIKIHWNKGEHSFTTSYGVYAYANPNAKVVLYVKRLAQKYGVSLNSRNNRELAKLNKSLTLQEKSMIRDLAYDLYVSKYVGHRVRPYLSPKELKTFFSISVVAGIGTARRAVQSALHVAVDGKIGNGTVKALESKPKDFNLGMVNYARRHFANIIKRHPAKHIYARGWENRMKALV